MPLVPPLAPVDENSIPPSPDVLEPGCAIPSIEPRSRSPTRIRSLQDSADALLDRINVILVGFEASQDAGNAPIPSAAPAVAPTVAPAVASAAVSSPGCPHCGNRFHKGAKCWFLTQPGKTVFILALIQPLTTIRNGSWKCGIAQHDSAKPEQSKFLVAALSWVS